LDDAVDVKLSEDPLVLDDPLIEGRLTAVEVYADQALDESQSMLEAFDVQKLADALQPGLLQDLGLGDFETLLSSPPFERIGVSRERIIQCCHCGYSTNWLHK